MGEMASGRDRDQGMGDMTSGPEQNHGDVLCDFAWKQFTDSRFVDVTIYCQGQTLSAHRILLCAFSSFFNTYLTENSSETNSLVSVDHLGINPEDLLTVIRYIYKQDMGAVSQIPSLIEAATQLGVNKLVSHLSNPKTEDNEVLKGKHSVSENSPDKEPLNQGGFPEQPTKVEPEDYDEDNGDDHGGEDNEDEDGDDDNKDDRTYTPPGICQAMRKAIESKDGPRTRRQTQKNNSSGKKQSLKKTKGALKKLLKVTKRKTVEEKKSKEKPLLPIKVEKPDDVLKVEKPKKVPREKKSSQCSECGKEFSALNALRRHMKTHATRKQYTCPLCQVSFPFAAQLTRHVKDSATCAGAAPFKCTVCEKAFNAASNLKIHARIHTGERPYKCPVCNKAFAISCALKEHSRIHSGEKGYLCNMCGKAFACGRDLNKHIRIHTGERPYPCRTCGKMFTRAEDVAKHARVHTGDKPYRCRFCDKAFAWANNLKKHVRIHLGEKPYVCCHCGDSFTQSQNLKRHEKIHMERPETDGISPKRMRVSKKSLPAAPRGNINMGDISQAIAQSVWNMPVPPVQEPMVMPVNMVNKEVAPSVVTLENAPYTEASPCAVPSDAHISMSESPHRLTPCKNVPTTPVHEGHMSEGHIQDGRMPDGRMPDGRMSDSHMPEGRLSEGRMSESRMSESRMPDGRMPDGRLSDGRMPDGRMSDSRMSSSGYMCETPTRHDMSQSEYISLVQPPPHYLILPYPMDPLGPSHLPPTTLQYSSGQ